MTDVLRSLRLDELGFAHGFNLRTGGVSSGAFGSFNLGRQVGDDRARVDENRARFARLVGYSEPALVEVDQVHGAAIVVVKGGDALVAGRGGTADGLVASRPGVAIGVRTADCVPILLAHGPTGAVAAIHAGWRGVLAGVVDAGVSALRNQSGARSGIVAAIFPHIRRCCFEVGPEVAEAFSDACPDASPVDRTREKPHVDLTRLVLAQLVRAGVAPDCVEEVAGCTRCEPARFFSFRRDGAACGRHLTTIVSR